MAESLITSCDVVTLNCPRYPELDGRRKPGQSSRLWVKPNTSGADGAVLTPV